MTVHVIETNPYDNQISVPQNIEITVVFDTDLDEDYINVDTVILYNEENANLQPILTYTSATKIVTITPSVLMPYTQYWVRIVGDADLTDGINTGIRGTSGEVLGGNYEFTFLTSAAINENPTIVSMNPGNQDTNVRVDIIPTVVFDKEIDSESVDSTTVYLVNRSGDLVASSLAVSDETVTLTPTNMLMPEEYYAFVIVGDSNVYDSVDTGVRDTDGLYLIGSVVAYFTTAAQTTVDITSQVTTALDHNEIVSRLRSMAGATLEFEDLAPSATNLSIVNVTPVFEGTDGVSTGLIGLEDLRYMSNVSRLKEIVVEFNTELQSVNSSQVTLYGKAVNGEPTVTNGGAMSVNVATSGKYLYIY